MFQLRDYQVAIATQCCAILKKYHLCFLILQPRVGKTLTSIYAAELYGAKKVLFLTKKKAIQSIIDDHAKIQSQINITVINYEQMYNLEDDFDFIICDESHVLSAFPLPSKKTKHLKKIAAGKPIIFLSATPTSESYSQIFHQLWVSSFSPFPHVNFYKWSYDYVRLKKKYVFNRQLNDYSDADRQKVEAMTKHLFISYTQKQAGFDMPVQEHILTVKMQDSTYWLANRLRQDKVFIGVNGSEIVADTEVKMMSKLHQIFSGTVIDEDGKYIAFDHSKAKFIADRFKGKKIAIFYKYKSEEVLINEYFSNTTSDPKEFNESNDKTFVSQVQSGREGINLSTADCLVMFNIDFSAVSYFQSRARLQTKDRVKASDVYWIFSEGGIEGRIHKAVMNKKDYTTNYFRKDYAVQ